MNTDFQLFPETASTAAGQTDALYIFLLALTAFFTVLIASLIIFFAIRYRRGAIVNRDKNPSGIWLELIWLLFPIPILLFIFYWGAELYFAQRRPPAACMEVSVVARQWMWKFGHPQGRREIDELHVPVNQPVRLNMISQDVIHSLFVPAFRLKQDVLPGRYTTLWFEANQTGEYHLFCAEYCGTNHARMRGRVIVMTQNAYETWLEGEAADSPAVAGRRLFEKFRCDGCHAPGAESRGPSLAGLFGKQVALDTGAAVIADDDYVRQSIVQP